MVKNVLKIFVSDSRYQFHYCAEVLEILNYFFSPWPFWFRRTTNKPGRDRAICANDGKCVLENPARKRESVLRHTHNEMLQLSNSHFLARTYLCLCGKDGGPARKGRHSGNLLKKKYQIVGSGPTKGCKVKNGDARWKLVGGNGVRHFCESW